MNIVSKEELEALANVFATILISAGLTPRDIKDMLSLTVDIASDLPYGIKDVCKEMELTPEEIHNIIDKCLNHELRTYPATKTEWLHMQKNGFIKKGLGNFLC